MRHLLEPGDQVILNEEVSIEGMAAVMPAGEELTFNGPGYTPGTASVSWGREFDFEVSLDVLEHDCRCAELDPEAFEQERGVIVWDE